MAVDAQILQQAVSDVCTGMLGLHIEPAHPCVCDESDALSAVIRISGDWDSLIQVLAPMSTARTIAANMFATDQADLTEAEIRDAVGEIVNMVGGNLKGIVEGDSRLSLPSVNVADSGSPFGTGFVGTMVSNWCQGDPLIVRILHNSMLAD